MRLPVELVEKVQAAAGLSRKTVDEFVEGVLADEISRWDDAFPLPEPPDDLQRRLDANPAAASFFATISRRNHYAVIEMIESAKRPQTRARRIDQAVDMLARGEAPYRH